MVLLMLAVSCAHQKMRLMILPEKTTETTTEKRIRKSYPEKKMVTCGSILV